MGCGNDCTPASQSIASIVSKSSTAIAASSAPLAVIAPHCELAGWGLYQCNRCKKQTSPTADTIFRATMLPLRLWFATIHPIATAKNGVSTVELARRHGFRQPTASAVGVCSARAPTSIARSAPARYQRLLVGPRSNGSIRMAQLAALTPVAGPARQRRRQTEPATRLTEKQCNAITRHRPAVETRLDPASPTDWK